MRFLDELFLRQAKQTATRRTLRTAGVTPRLTGKPSVRVTTLRSSRRCSECGQVTPAYRLVQPGHDRAQLCIGCRQAELSGAVR